MLILLKNGYGCTKSMIHSNIKYKIFLLEKMLAF